MSTVVDFVRRPIGIVWDDVVIDLRRYGLSSSASAASNAAAFTSAIADAALLGGGVLQAPPGLFALDPVTIAVDNVWIRGSGRGTVWIFDPAADSVLFDWTRGASSIMFGGMSQCSFFSNNTVRKTAIRVRDGRSMEFDHLTMSDTGWQGTGSVGIQMLGRDSCVFYKNQLRCERPILFDLNPNEANIQTDFFRIVDNVDGSTATAGTTYEFADGVTLTNVLFAHNASVLSKWGVRWNDTSSPHVSYNVVFLSNRWEQASDASGFCIELTSTAQRIQEVTVIDGHFDVARNGLKVRQAERVTLIDSQFGSVLTNIDMTFETYSSLALLNTHVQVGSTVTLTNGMLVRESPFNTAETVVSKSAEYLHTSIARPYRVGVPLGLTDGITAPATLAGVAQIYVDTADGDLKVKFGDGTVKTIVTDT